MKARIQMKNRPSVWLYQTEDCGCSAAVSLAAKSCSAEYHTFGTEKAGMTVEKIITGADESCPDSSVPVGPVLLMDGFDSKSLDRFLFELREQCSKRLLPVIELKAVVTPINRKWIFSKLADEILSEHNLMHGK